VIPIIRDGATNLISRGKLKLLKIMPHNFMNYTIRQIRSSMIKRSIHHLTSILPTSNGNHLHIVLTLRIAASSQATPSPQSNSDVQAQILKLMGEINQKLTQTVTPLSQTLNSHSESIAKIEAHEEKPSPIDWPPQQQSQQEQYTPQFFAEMEAKMDAHFEQIMNHLNREEEELQR
jgi:hypothetical protein